MSDESAIERFRRLRAAMDDFGSRCEHGSLRRKCDTCWATLYEVGLRALEEEAGGLTDFVTRLDAAVAKGVRLPFGDDGDAIIWTLFHEDERLASKTCATQCAP